MGKEDKLDVLMEQCSICKACGATNMECAVCKKRETILHLQEELKEP